MSKYHTLTFNDISLLDYQCFYDYSQAFRTPTKLMDMFHIEGRNGDLSISQNSYSNITIPFNCHIRKDFNENGILSYEEDKNNINLNNANYEKELSLKEQKSEFLSKKLEEIKKINK